MDAVEPQRLGRFWEAVVGGERLTDVPEGFETRLAIEGGPELDLCFQRVPEPPSEPLRLHLDLLGGARQAEVVERLIGLGARHLDIGQGDAPWVVLGDPEGNPFCVMEERSAYVDTGPIAGSRSPPPTRTVTGSSGPGWPVGLTRPATRLALFATRRCEVPSSSCARKRPARARRRTGCTSISGSRPERIPMKSRRALPSAAATSSAPTGESCRGGTTQTRRATSSACCQRGREARVATSNLIKDVSRPIPTRHSAAQQEGSHTGRLPCGVGVLASG